jgi:ABC-type multidrug transport system fused ATPase/permease subunit
MFRFYDPQDGAIFLDDINIRDLPVRQLRQHIGFIPQDVQLFHGKLRDNLTLFKTEILDEDIFRALKQLELMEWYETLPDGLETYIEGNQRLSAGEAQLITSVRIFLQHPAIIILDEASARIDPITEYRLKRAYDTLLKGRIAIIIAHRLETLENTHKILLLNQGRVQEYGLYHQLASDSQSQFYALLHTHQTEAGQ